VFGLSVSALCRTWYARPLNCPDLTCGRQGKPLSLDPMLSLRSVWHARTHARTHARKHARTIGFVVHNKCVENDCSCEQRVSFHPDAITRRMKKGWCWSKTRKETTTEGWTLAVSSSRPCFPRKTISRHHHGKQRKPHAPSHSKTPREAWALQTQRLRPSGGSGQWQLQQCRQTKGTSSSTSRLRHRHNGAR